MDWTDEGFVLAARRHGESSAIVQLLTRARGRHAGLLRGGAGRRGRALIEVGNLVSAHWRARLSDQLGNFQLELVRANAQRVMDRPGPLAALLSAAALLAIVLPDHEPHPGAFSALAELIEALDEAKDWSVRYVRWEQALLAEIGYGLDLSRCAVTGATEDLVYVSPRTGRAVSREGAKGYEGRLLSLPAFLVGRGEADGGAIRDALLLTGHFIESHALAPAERKPPPARARLMALVGRD